MPINSTPDDALDKSKKSTWEEIEKSNLSVAHLNYVDTFLKVNDKVNQYCIITTNSI